MNKKLHTMLRLNLVIMCVTALMLLVLIICKLSNAPSSQWNDARLAPVAAWLRGFPFYTPEDSGVLVGNYYPPLGDLAFLPAGLFDHPLPAIITGSALSLLMNLSAAICGLLMLSRHLGEPFKFVVLGSVFYLALLMINPGTEYGLFAIHVDAPAIALMLWGVIFYARWWAYRSTTSLAASAVLFSSVVWAKQLGFPLPLIYCALTFLIGGARVAIIFAAWSLVASIFWPLVLAPIIADWHAFFFSIWSLPARHPWNGQVTGGATEHVRLYLATSVTFLRQYWLYYLLTLAVVLALSAKQSGQSTWRFAFALATSAFIASITMLPLSVLGWVKVGGDVNSLAYTLQPLLFALVVGGLAFVAISENAGVQWNLIAQSVICVALVLFIVILRPTREMLHYPIIVSQQPVVTAYEESKSGDTWFPQFPLSTLLASGHLYHHGWSIFAVDLAGKSVSMQRLAEGMPKAPFKLKYLTGDQYQAVEMMIKHMKIPPGDFTQKQVGPWQELLVQKFPG